ncbi:MAG TPA: CBS domain-containing protein [Anaerolineales bacterium]|nr:CBS domain-containing protein [Anaerolineales bacterium]
MKEQLVRNWMTPDPITISPSTTLPQAQQIMMEKNIRRLPVVWDGKLVGILTFGDIREAKPSEANTLSVYELNYLLDRLTVKAIMTSNPITVDPDATIGQAANIMLEKKIGGIPVVENGRLVGIITETDLCRLIVAEGPNFITNATKEKQE